MDGTLTEDFWREIQYVARVGEASMFPWPGYNFGPGCSLMRSIRHPNCVFFYGAGKDVQSGEVGLRPGQRVLG
jgi:hypothetical protein